MWSLINAFLLSGKQTITSCNSYPDVNSTLEKTSTAPRLGGISTQKLNVAYQNGNPLRRVENGRYDFQIITFQDLKNVRRLPLPLLPMGIIKLVQYSILILQK
jgi:hypothetical protein